MRLKLKKITLVNFKGIRNLSVDFNHITNIYGDNATGKTTIFDAFLWLFFGKNSEDSAQFGIKRNDDKGNFIPKQETEVEAIIHLDDQEISIKKVLRQKWTKRRGELNETYTGDENIYFWNDVPFKEGEFKTKVKDIIDETLFKLITNPFYFNTMKWQERRNLLVTIAGNINDNEIFDSIVNVSNKSRFNALINALNSGKSIDEYKRELAAKKTKIKNESESIPSRIDEVKRGLPEDINFDVLRAQLEEEKGQLDLVQNSISSAELKEKETAQQRVEALKHYNKLVQDLQQQKFNLQSKIQSREFEAKQKAKEQADKINAEINSINNKISTAKADEQRYTTGIGRLESEINETKSKVDQLREEYISKDAEVLVFKDDEFVCPSCKQSLPFSDVETKQAELTNNFNNDKLSKLKVIKEKGELLNQEIEALEKRVENGKQSIESAKADQQALEAELTVLNEKIKNLSTSTEDEYKSILASDTEYTAWKSELEILQNQVIAEPEKVEATEIDKNLQDRRTQLNNSIININRELAKEEQIQKSNERITQLSEQETKLSQELAELEGYEFAIMEYTKAKVDAIEQRINGKFLHVRFKMFNQQVNGGEAETCETLVNTNGAWVPFTDGNNAGRINAGVDIINTMCKHYDVYAPIFIDNREGVTRLIDSDSQIVNLIVSEPDKKIRIA